MTAFFNYQFIESQLLNFHWMKKVKKKISNLLSLICRIHLKKKSNRTLFGVIIFILLPTFVYSTEIVEWKEDTKKIALGKYISILEDKEKKFSLADIQHFPHSENFIPSDKEIPNFGITESAFWIRFSIKNPTNHSIDLLLELDQAQYDLVEFYDTIPETNQISKVTTGDQYPFSTRPIEYYNYLFPIQIQPLAEKQFYFRLIMNGPTIIPINLWEPKSFFSHSLFVMYAFGTFLGLMGIMCIYNLFLFFSIKDISYLYYVLLVGGILQTSLTFTGLDTQYLWQNSPLFGEYIHHWGIVGTNFFAGLFTTQFLNTKENLPRLHKLLLSLMFISIAVLFLPFLFHITVSIKANVPLVVSSLVIYFTAGFINYRKGKAEARFYLLAWGGVMLGALVFALNVIDILPDNFLIRYSMQIASTAQVVLFSFALADRINILKRERENALIDKLAESEKVASLGKAFEKFVPKQFLEYLDKESITSIQLGDNTQRIMTILFCDIRSFTDISEKMTPNDNFQFINDYLSRVGPLIRSHGGFIDKYIGDAIMALFPEKVESAIDSAISIQKEVKKFNEIRREKKQTLIHIGIGIHTGNLMLGTVGEENRMDTTVISDAVNLASRLEGLTKELNAPIIVSQIAFSKLGNPENYPYRVLGDFFVKGKKESIPLVEIIEGSLDNYAPEKIQTKERFEEAVKLYQTKDFSSALKELKSILKIFPQDSASKLYVIRCQEQLSMENSNNNPE